MIAFPIPTAEPVSPILVVVFAIAAVAGFVALVYRVVQYFRNSGDHTDVFGPPLPRDDDKRDDTKDEDPSA